MTARHRSQRRIAEVDVYPVGEIDAGNRDALPARSRAVVGCDGHDAGAGGRVDAPADLPFDRRGGILAMRFEQIVEQAIDVGFGAAERAGGGERVPVLPGTVPQLGPTVERRQACASRTSVQRSRPVRQPFRETQRAGTATLRQRPVHPLLLVAGYSGGRRGAGTGQTASRCVLKQPIDDTRPTGWLVLHVGGRVHVRLTTRRLVLCGVGIRARSRGGRARTGPTTPRPIVAPVAGNGRIRVRVRARGARRRRCVVRRNRWVGPVRLRGDGGGGVTLRRRRSAAGRGEQRRRQGYHDHTDDGAVWPRGARTVPGQDPAPSRHRVPAAVARG